MRMGRVPKDELEQTAITKKRYMQNKCQNDQIDLQVGMQWVIMMNENRCDLGESSSAGRERATDKP